MLQVIAMEEPDNFDRTADKSSFQYKKFTSKIGKLANSFRQIVQSSLSGRLNSYFANLAKVE